MDIKSSIKALLGKHRSSGVIIVSLIALLLASIGQANVSRRANNGAIPMLSSKIVPTTKSSNQESVSAIETQRLTVEEVPMWKETLELRNSKAEWKTIRMRVTAYCPCKKCCGRHSDGYTASMHKILRGDRFVASDRKFTFGTELKIPGYNNSKIVKVEDRGRLIKGNKIDVFFNSHSQAKKWGVKYIDVQVRGD